MSLHPVQLRLLMAVMQDKADRQLIDSVGKVYLGRVSCEARVTAHARTAVQYTWRVDGKVVKAKHITEDMFDDALAERGGASASEA